MVAGQLDRYRAKPHRLGEGMVSGPDVAARLDAPAEGWFAVWLRRYEIVTDHGNLAASYAAIEPLRIRPVSAWLAGLF